MGLGEATMHRASIVRVLLAAAACLLFAMVAMPEVVHAQLRPVPQNDAPDLVQAPQELPAESPPERDTLPLLTPPESAAPAGVTFRRVTPGVTTQAQLVQAWGAPVEQDQRDGR